MTPDKPITLNEHVRHQTIASWFQSILNQTTGPYTTPNHPNALFYKLDCEVIFEYDRKNGVFWVDHNKIWLVFADRFGVKHFNEIREHIKPMVEEHYNLEDVIPLPIFFNPAIRGFVEDRRSLQLENTNN